MSKLTKKESFAIYLRLLKSAKPYWFYFLLGVIGTILATAVDSGFAWAIKPFLDKGLVDRNQDLLHWLPMIIVFAVVLRGITYFMSNYYVARVGRSVVMDFRRNIFAHLMHMPAEFYDHQSSGKLLAVISYNTEQVAGASTEAVLTIMQEGLTLIGLIIVMFIVSWQLTLLFMVTAPLISFVMRYNTKRLRMLSKKVQQTVGDVTHIANEGIESYRVVRIFGGEEYEKNKFAKAVYLNCQRELKVIMTNSLGTSIVQILATLPIVIIIYVATLPSLHISVGSFGAIIASILRLLTPMRRLTKINTDIQKGIAGAQSIFELLDSDLERDFGTLQPQRINGSIEYRNVNFAYKSSNKKILTDINFKVDAGKTIAFVGRSGGGKSTLISLLPRFYDVTSGEIFIDNEPLKNYQLKDLRKQISIVSQHLTLFNDTIANNIAYGDLANADKDKIIKVAKMANAMDFIEQLPHGLDTMIGDNGLMLSGGQRQRIAIARALLKQAPILILDEATSALDTESEVYIQEALTKLMQHSTTLVIAHRLSTIEKADKIMVVEKGKIIESGTHEELLANSGMYAKLSKMQFK